MFLTGIIYTIFSFYILDYNRILLLGLTASLLITLTSLIINLFYFLKTINNLIRYIAGPVLLNLFIVLNWGNNVEDLKFIGSMGVTNLCVSIFWLIKSNRNY